MSNFAQTVKELSIAESAAKAASGNASEARSARSTVAVETIGAAFKEKLSGSDVRTTLLAADIAKGTVSKIVTILEAIHNGVLTVKDIQSLNGAYNLVKAAEKAASAPPVGSPTVPFAGATGGAVATSPQEAFDVIVDYIKSVTDADEAFKLGGEWIAKITTGITDALTAREDEEDE